MFNTEGLFFRYRLLRVSTKAVQKNTGDTRSVKQQIKYVLIIFIIVVAIITALKLFNIIYVSQMVGAFILVVIFLIVILSGTIASKTVPKLGKDVIITFVIILGLLVFTTYISVSTQIFSINSIQSQFDLGGMTIILNREPTGYR